MDFNNFLMFEYIYIFRTMKQETKQEGPYKKSLFDRLLLYSFFYIVYMVPYNLTQNLHLFSLIQIIITFPYINNLLFEKISNLKYVLFYYKIKTQYLIYLKIKLYFCFIKYLDKHLIEVNYKYDTNDQLFYNVIKNNHFTILFKNLLYVIFMYFLRDNEQTYFFYKTIKLSHYYNSKFLFNKMDVFQSKILLENIFKKKEYHKMNSIEYAQSIFRIFHKEEKDVFESLKETITKWITKTNIYWGIIWVFHILTGKYLNMYINIFTRFILFNIYFKSKDAYACLISNFLFSIFSTNVIYGDLIILLYFVFKEIIKTLVLITFYFMKLKIELKNKKYLLKNE